MQGWLRRLAHWLIEAKVFWMAVAVLAASLYPVFLLDLPEGQIRFAGLVLQLLGLCTVLYGISQTRTLFKLPPITASAISWLRRFPKIRLKRVTGRIVGLAAEVDAAGRAKARFTAPPGAPIEDRVRVLESNLRILDETVDNLRDQIEHADRKGREALAAESRARQQEVQGVSEKLALAQTGGLSLSLVGLVWLMAGLIVTTASQELASLG